jgi:hypothetical protein
MSITRSIKRNLVLVCLVVAGVFPIDAADAQTAISSIRVPVAVCNTGSFVEWQPSWTPPKQVTVQLPATEGRQVAMYMGFGGYPQVIAQRGWSCLAAQGGDGNNWLDVAPAGKPPSSSKWTAGQGISIQDDPACVSCRLELACPFFSYARLLYSKYYPGLTGCTPAPPTETVYQLGNNAVAFSDPPHVMGDGVPSGGSYEANGVAMYSDQSGSVVSTCTLPNADRWLCTASLDRVLVDYRT